MNTTKILTIVMAVVWIALAFYLFYSIKFSIDEKERISDAEAEIVKKLELIREAQIAYAAVNGKYTSGWDSLVSFLDSGVFYLTEKTETITQLAYGAEEVTVNIDTLGTVPVMDSLFTAQIRATIDINDISYVPIVEPKTQFDLWAGKINKAGLLVNVIEVKNPKPIDPGRDEESEYNTRKPLRFGSRYNVTTAGNWE